MKQSFSAFFVLGLTAGCVSISACSSDKSEVATAKPPGEGIEIFIAHTRVAENRIYASGSILANEEIELRNEVSGRITALNLQEGSKVSKGQVLLEIDAEGLRAELEKINVQLDLAQKDLARKVELLAIKGISQEAYDQSRSAVETLKADRELVQVRLRNSKIIAPFSGRVGLRDVSLGGYIQTGERIATLVQDHIVKIEFTVPQGYAGMIKEGQTIRFKSNDQRATFEAEIYAKEPRIDELTRTLRVRARCDNPDGLFVPGAFVDIEIELDRNEAAIMLPSELIIPELLGQKVLVYRNGVVENTPVEIGMRTATEVEIIDGVAAGDSIIATGLLALKNGASVTIRSIQNDEQQP